MLFNDRYRAYHMGNITQQSFKSIWESDVYWKIIRKLGSKSFNAQTMCGSLCLHHSVNKYLDEYIKGERELIEPTGEKPEHMEFI